MSSDKPNKRAKRQARRQARERDAILNELRSSREQAYRALQIGTELGVMDVVSRAAERVRQLDGVIRALQSDSMYTSWQHEHLNV
jgi:hypothetical protein